MASRQIWQEVVTLSLVDMHTSSLRHDIIMTVNGDYKLSLRLSYLHASPYYTSCIILARVGVTLIDVSLTALSSKPRRTVTTVVCESNWCAGGILCTG